MKRCVIFDHWLLVPFFTCEVMHQKDMAPQTGGLCPCKIGGSKFHSVVANHTQMWTADCREENNLTVDCHEENNCNADCHKEKNRTADCHIQGFKFERRWPRGYTTVHLRAICQGVIPVLENRGIGVRFAKKAWNPDLTGVKPICGGLLRPKLYNTSMISVLHTIF
jgi:hypothetical protein